MNSFSFSFTACVKRRLLAIALVIAPLASAQEVIVLSGFDEISHWMKSENWWGEEKRSEQLQVPRVLITGISPRWKDESSKLAVADKKELFYRFILPLVVHRADGNIVANREVFAREHEFAVGCPEPPVAVSVDPRAAAAAIASSSRSAATPKRRSPASSRARLCRA